MWNTLVLVACDLIGCPMRHKLWMIGPKCDPCFTEPAQLLDMLVYIMLLGLQQVDGVIGPGFGGAAATDAPCATNYGCLANGAPPLALSL